ncbi:hypothetical protein RF11_15674 [Thelohanellus kitauei]|uniref:Cystatin domain-containing protein n=1 Tax=Thelohanellus kitauei TaxID=669202 RepID=A0A0C2N0J1_THEKT|nr:hypothetical protein RF11_15674 [Thelohanellus kitauei]
MLKAAVFLFVIKMIDAQLLGGWDKLHPLDDEEKKVFEHVKKSFEDGTHGLKSFKSAYAELLKHATDANIKVQEQVVAGTNFLFEIPTSDPTARKLYLKVFRGLPFDPVIEVEYLDTKHPQ